MRHKELYSYEKFHQKLFWMRGVSNEELRLGTLYILHESVRKINQRIYIKGSIQFSVSILFISSCTTSEDIQGLHFSVRRSRQRTAALLVYQRKKGIFYATQWWRWRQCAVLLRRVACPWWGFSTTIKVRRTDSICHGSNQAEMMHCNLSLCSSVTIIFSSFIADMPWIAGCVVKKIGKS